MWIQDLKGLYRVQQTHVCMCTHTGPARAYICRSTGAPPLAPSPRPSAPPLRSFPALQPPRGPAHRPQAVGGGETRRRPIAALGIAAARRRLAARPGLTSPEPARGRLRLAAAALRPRPSAPPLPHPPGGSSSSDRRRSASLAVRAGRLQRAMAASAGRSLPLLLCRRRGAAAAFSAAGCFPALGRRRQQQRHRTVSEAESARRVAVPFRRRPGRVRDEGAAGAFRPPAQSRARGGQRRRRQLRVILSAAKLERSGGPPRADPIAVNFPRARGGGEERRRSGAGPGRAGPGGLSPAAPS